MKKFMLICLVALFAIGGAFASGQNESGTKHIGVAIPSADHGWTGGIVWWANKRVKELEAEYGDQFKFTVVTADGPSSQVQAVENMMAIGLDYLVILPHESAPLTPIVKEAQASGTKCIVVDRGMSETDFGYVNLAGDNPGFGTLSGEWMVKEMVAKGGGNIVCMGGLPVPIDKERMDGFFAELDKEPSIVNLLGKDKYEFANWSTQKGLELMETFLIQYPKIDAVFCQDDDVLRGVLQAYKESGRSDIHTFLGGAGSKVVMKMIMDGDPLVRATVTYHPMMIADGIDYAVDVALGKKSADFHEKSSPTSVVIPSVLLTKDNVADYYEADSIY
ncbi:MAG: substrate-binding domain-containing protein [Spirochaetales bacterium]|nr:substrate-binding domain-containing protein [Spirochaetales bacterium]